MNRQPTAHFLVHENTGLVCVQTVQLLVNADEKCCIHPLQLVISESHKKKKRRLETSNSDTREVAIRSCATMHG